MENKDPYTNREIDTFIKRVDGKLDSIIHQTTKHNTRLTKVEYKQAMFIGGLTVLSMVVLPIAGWVLYQVALTV